MKGTPIQDSIHIQNCEAFCSEVETMIRSNNSKAEERERTTGQKAMRLNYIEAVLAVAEKRRIDPDYAAAYLSPDIKEKLKVEYENRHMLPKTAKLSFE